ncbi:hypothetical protein [uncultured Methylobacterium sp.]|uniref:hypothetical protein n=1 Tax=uncultured Methylobacterium sp. TaxID=157278 RepID=UPI0026339A47|nr:hypothetical protein [uncultured Methylobacterium sp.]
MTRLRHAARRWPAPLLLALLAGPAGAQENEARNECRRTPALSTGPALAYGRIAATGRTAFVKDGLARAGCPGPDPACRERAYLVPGDGVILGERRGAWICATYRGDRDDMGRTGWVSAEAVAVETSSAVSVEGWLGTWTRAEAQIRVTPGGRPGTVSVDGGATWGGGDPDRAARGGIHTGEIAGTVAPKGDAASFAMGESETLPVERGDPADCKVWLRRLGPWLVVDDNLACGGVNVTFRGVYRRRP